MAAPVPEAALNPAVTPNPGPSVAASDLYFSGGNVRVQMGRGGGSPVAATFASPRSAAGRGGQIPQSLNIGADPSQRQDSDLASIDRALSLQSEQRRT